MAATSEMMALVSEFPVDDTGASLFTTAVFNHLSSIALIQLQEDIGTGSLMPATIQDYCHALLIAHKYSIQKGLTGYTSQSAQGYSVQRAIGETAYLKEYQHLISKYSGSALAEVSGGTTGSGSSGYDSVKRADADMSPLCLDESEIPVFFSGV